MNKSTRKSKCTLGPLLVNAFCIIYPGQLCELFTLLIVVAYAFFLCLDENDKNSIFNCVLPDFKRR